MFFGTRLTDSLLDLLLNVSLGPPLSRGRVLGLLSAVSLQPPYLSVEAAERSVAGLSGV